MLLEDLELSAYCTRWEKVKAEKVANVFQMVKLLRIQRPGIVEDLVRVAVIFRKLNYTVVFCCRTNIVLFLVQHCNFFNHLKTTFYLTARTFYMYKHKID